MTPPDTPLLAPPAPPPAGDLALVAALVRFPLLLAGEAARLAGVALPAVAADDEHPDGRAAA